MDKIRQLANDLKKQPAVVFTGAGVSTNSGIPDFRSETGFYQKYHEEDLAIDAFFKDPDRFYIAFQEKFSSVFQARPNETHLLLTELEKSGYIKGIVTQNVDRLHQKAGSVNVLEFHGNIFEYDLIQVLDAEQQLYKTLQYDVPVAHLREGDQLQYRVGLNTLYKPNVVLYGENVKCWSESLALSQACHIHIIMGTSFSVSPFNMLSYENKDEHLKVYVINKQPIQYYPFNNARVIQIIGDTSDILNQLMQKINDPVN